jgi:hypothetical protein
MLPDQLALPVVKTTQEKPFIATTEERAQGVVSQMAQKVPTTRCVGGGAQKKKKKKKDGGVKWWAEVLASALFC